MQPRCFKTITESDIYKLTNEDINNDDKLITLIEKYIKTPSYFVAYLFSKVLIGRYNEKKFISYDNQPNIFPKYLIKLRIFNENEEIYLWRKSESIFAWRYKKDEENHEQSPCAEQSIIDVKQILWGTKVEGYKCNEGSDWVCLSEERGMKLIIPFNINKFTKYNQEEDNSKNRVKILTRHYIEYNEIGQAGYVDARMVQFVI
ncbi:MAG: CRISPR-associated protein Csx19 [Candidatus Magnetoovum sp. WYHC-5]|nr:CRISPR-associated protein Csx19 [Candidatus Magnetoovum sp. WYHC-5]